MSTVIDTILDQLANVVPVEMDYFWHTDQNRTDWLDVCYRIVADQTCQVTYWVGESSNFLSRYAEHSHFRDCWVQLLEVRLPERPGYDVQRQLAHRHAVEVAAGRRFRPVYGRSMAVCQSKRQRPATATGGTRETLRALHQRGAGPC